MVRYERKTIDTPDEDFLDLDWSYVQSKSLAIISHGLEGSSDTYYCKGMVHALNSKGIDALVWNYRGCSGRANKKANYYHSGFTKDLDTVVQHVVRQYQYQSIYLIGFSVGGNITLKYLGENQYSKPNQIKLSVSCSVPCHLEATASHLKSSLFHKIYLNRFLKSLKNKIKLKAHLLDIDLKELDKISDFKQFDDRFTAPMFAYKDALEYWEHNSCIHYIKTLSIPSFLVMAKNDPFFSKECFPIKQAHESDFLYLEMPTHGGHCGFGMPIVDSLFWFEKRALDLILNSEFALLK
jgi:hypothetical protein